MPPAILRESQALEDISYLFRKAGLLYRYMEDRASIFGVEAMLREEKGSWNEYVQYSCDFEKTCTRVEEKLSSCNSPQELVMALLVEAVRFYDGDWAGILDADLTTKVWSPLWWYNRKRDGMTDNKFYDLHEGEYLHRWVNALANGTPIRIEDIEELADASPLEYTFLRSLGVKLYWRFHSGNGPRVS